MNTNELLLLVEQHGINFLGTDFRFAAISVRSHLSRGEFYYNYSLTVFTQNNSSISTGNVETLEYAMSLLLLKLEHHKEVALKDVLEISEPKKGEHNS